MSFSGLQKKVFSLYRSFLRTAKTKQQSTVQDVIFIKNKFRSSSKDVDKNDFRRIEFLIRKGEKQLKLYSLPTTRTIHK